MRLLNRYLKELLPEMQQLIQILISAIAMLSGAVALWKQVHR